ncbi:wax ester/triacylglycerol synthase family O-acyltransferase [Nocardia implantans]|uniref:Diacylglycerol O-acyltransferase n=1 Tax=Nocardia implantans TaxID=3108168 RepID=A0ABU6AS66_9NOCA|nr:MULTISPECIES: wax ester/triacylglycerol synthase family O-acyltransferase [unclassified Nocardia]MBF6191771.1 wax ester/triacylglycerol synthase family O-acyltransferase [Nocardia beijingensis]MEA3527918.1 wax ester/triacylglycerol synthase family O-acyltransferase [Nocardia sp. CDC192]MEB3510330.1 wax ester/triacylglycerol synthase family O-acyltransferase [Nocardia sp. CDC186]
MTELRPLDSGFMELEDADRHISLGIGAVAIVAGAPPSRSELSGVVARGVERNARLRQKVRRAPLDLTVPVWEDDPDFDLAHHIRWTALPTPGDETALCELVATELEERLDRDHPLWQCVVVEHLAGDRWALLVKAHHSLVDGVSGISVFQSFCDAVTGEPRDTAEPQGRTEVRWPDLVREVSRLPVVLPRSVAAMTRGLAPLLSALVSPAVESSLNGPIGRQRRYVVARAALADVHEIGAAFDVTVNDVVLAAVAAAYRELLVGRGERLSPDKLRILVPVSMRSEQAKYTLDNRVSAVLPFLPIEIADPVERLKTIRERMNRHKSGGQAQAEDSVLALAGLLPFAPLAWTFRLLARFPQRTVGALVTNVPGPREELTVRGQVVSQLLPAMPIAMRLRTAIAVLSYAGHLTFGITGDYDTAPDVAVLAEGIEREIRRLRERAGIRRPSRPEVTLP